MVSMTAKDSSLQIIGALTKNALSAMANGEEV